MLTGGLLAACGGASTAEDLSEEGLMGSYELVFQGVTRHEDEEPSIKPASEGALLHVELRKAADGCEAVVTWDFPIWTEPHCMKATVTSSAVLLEGRSGVDYGFDADATWTKLVFPRAGGALTGAVSAEGEELVRTDDLYTRYRVTSGGTIRPDYTPPTVYLAWLGSAATTGPLRPGDLLSIQTTEGVDRAALLAAIDVQLTTDEGGTETTTTPRVEWTFTPDASERTAWAGVISGTGRLVDWPKRPGALTMTVAEGVPDLAGNTGSAVGFTIDVTAASPE